MTYHTHLSLSPLRSASGARDLSIGRALDAIREHLGMDVAYLSEFEGDETVFREVSAPGLEALIKPGDRRSLDDVYCRYILDGRLPELMPDTSAEPLAAAMSITGAVPIGSHMSLPVRLPDGEVYGMFCCLGAKANPTLNERDLATMRMFADLATERVAERVTTTREVQAKREAIRAALTPEGFGIALQPIVRLADGAPGGHECLSRFRAEPYRPPNEWFDDAEACGMGSELEIAAIERALDHAAAAGEAYLSVNVSPTVIVDPLFAERVGGALARGGAGIMLEVTEHARVADYGVLHAVLAPLRERGMRLAVDDAGAGYASFNHILELRPDVIKLDMGLVRDLHVNASRRSLVAGMALFAREMGMAVVAEGVEVEGERDALVALGIDYGQGWLFGRPVDPFVALAA